MRRAFFSLSVLTLVGGCVYDEHLPQVDIHGRIIVPAAAGVRPDPVTGEDMPTDRRFLGPVFLGAFPDVRDDLFDYPHPEMGPVIATGVPGNTFPYGGGSVGRFDFGCFSSTACEIVTGRYTDWDDLLSFFRDKVGQPITDEQGGEVESVAFYRSYCNELFEYTADYEYSFISGEDGLDFYQNSDGDWEAEFDLWQVTYQPGMKIWGWMDSPNERFSFSTCNRDDGQTNGEYTNDIKFGTNFSDLLNFPSRYVHDGDWVVSEAFEVTPEDADAFRDGDLDIVIRADFLYSE